MGALKLGDEVWYNGAERRVVDFTGPVVRLESPSEPPTVVLLTYLLSSPDFELLTGKDSRAALVPPRSHQLDDVDPRYAERARTWEHHIVEVETGLPPGGDPEMTPRPEYDPSLPLAQRDAAKAAELTATGTATTARQVKRMRLRYRAGGVRNLVDGRTTKPITITGRVDPRVVRALRQVIDSETDQSTGTRSRLHHRVVELLNSIYEAGTVPIPSRTTMYRLDGAMTTGRHTFGSATTRRSLANRPARPFSQTWALRPGQQIQIDTTTLDILAIHADGQARRVELTVAIDVATRTICAAILRPHGTKAVDVSLLLAKMLVPEPMRPGWSDALRLSMSRLPSARLIDVDQRMEHAAAKPVIVPECITCDRGRVYLSQNFISACESRGISVQPAHPYTPTDKAIIERTFGSINTLFCQYVAGYTGRDPTRRGKDLDKQALWSIEQLQDLIDEWIVVGWQQRPHEGLIHPDTGQILSPNEMYGRLVAAAGCRPLPLSGDDYIDLLPATWLTINDYGVRIGARTYDDPALNDCRREHSGVKAQRGRWKVHHDPYDLLQVWVRDHRVEHGWIRAEWTYAKMVGAPFSDVTWRTAQHHARAANGDQPASEQAVAHALNDLLRRAQQGPVETRVAPPAAAKPAASHQVEVPRLRLQPVRDEDPSSSEVSVEARTETDHANSTLPQERDDDQRNVIPFQIFDARAEARRWR